MTPSDLKAWRTSLGLSQRAAASALGITLITYQGLERGVSYSSKQPIEIDRRTELACLAISAGITHLTHIR